DARIYGDIVEGLETDFPATASVFTAMQAEEIGHRRRLAEQYRGRFGEHVPLIRRQDVKGFVQHKPVWLVRPLGIAAVRGLAPAPAPRSGPALAPHTRAVASGGGGPAGLGGGTPLGSAGALSAAASWTGPGGPLFAAFVCGS